MGRTIGSGVLGFPGSFVKTLMESIDLKINSFSCSMLSPVADEIRSAFIFLLFIVSVSFLSCSWDNKSDLLYTIIFFPIALDIEGASFSMSEMEVIISIIKSTLLDIWQYFSVIYKMRRLWQTGSIQITIILNILPFYFIYVSHNTNYYRDNPIYSF